MWADLLRVRFKCVWSGPDLSLAFPRPCTGATGWAAFVERHGIVYRPQVWGASRPTYVARSPLSQPYPQQP